MPYDIKQNYGGCSGYAVVGPDGKVKGCHTTQEKARAQQSALYSVEEKIKKAYQMLDPSEKAFHDALVSVAEKYGKFSNETPIYAGYEPAVENENVLKGIVCGNCSFWQGDGVCQIVAGQIDYFGYCRLAAIPSQLVNSDAPEIEVEEEEMNKASSVSVGSMVSWNSSGGRAEGKVKRIIRNGSYNVPNSDFTINGTPENPAVVIEVYRDGKPTGTMVGHRMNTLSAKKSLWVGMFDPRSISKNG